MEVLFGFQFVNSVVFSSEFEQSRRKFFFDRFFEISFQLVEEDLFFEELEEDEMVVMDEKVEELGLEFDDIDYSEFYIRCEDKESIIIVEVLSIKKFLQFLIIVLFDFDIEFVVMLVIERRVLILTLDKEELIIEF